jgi:Dolichyl-phosphate-mannose-protein mannosyltransferase
LLQSSEMSQRSITARVPLKQNNKFHAEGASALISAILVLIGFCWRLWLAHATFFSTDEAWHYSVANQNSLLAAYKASLTLAHPPLLIFVLYFWKHLGTSDLALRFPGVLASTVFCWFFFKWLERLFGTAVALVGATFVSLLPPLIALTTELRQYSFILMFSILAAYFLELALDQNSAVLMLLSSGTLWLAMLSHYSAFLFAGAVGIYVIVRLTFEEHSKATIAAWALGQALGIALAAFLYRSHIARLGRVYHGEPLHRFADFYLSYWYFHPGRDNLLHFLWRGTFGIFRFIFGQTALGQISAVLFFIGVILLITSKPSPNTRRQCYLRAVLLVVPFVLNWLAVILGLYPYGRTRQCIVLSVFGLAGTSIALAKIARDRFAQALALTLMTVIGCQIFGTLQGRDMLPLADQRHEHMDEMLRFLREYIHSSDVIFTDRATEFQLGHYLCQKKPVPVAVVSVVFESFRCDGFPVVVATADNIELTADTFDSRLQELKNVYAVNVGTNIWVVQGGWAKGLGEALRSHSEAFAQIEPHTFGRYLEVFMVPRNQESQVPKLCN